MNIREKKLQSKNLSQKLFPLAIIFSIILLSSITAYAEQGKTIRVSVDSSGGEVNSSSSYPSISSDGRYVAFHSGATNLVTDDTNDDDDIFVHDTQTGETIRVSVNSSGNEGNRQSIYPAISSDGRYVAFYSNANNLVADDTNSSSDIFVHDTQTGETIRVSVNSAGIEGNNSISNRPSISSDGRYVAFQSFATNLVADDTNSKGDIFVHDTQTGETIRASVNSSGIEGNNYSLHPSISSDGRYVAFESVATNLVADDTNSGYDIFVHDTQTGKTTRVNVNSLGVEAYHSNALPAPLVSSSRWPSISSDGRYVAFQSGATNLVVDDTNIRGDIFVHDTQTGETIRASVNSSGIEGNNHSNYPSISSDGRYVAFQSGSTNLVVNDMNGGHDIFVHDTQTGETVRASVNSSGIEGNQWILTSPPPSISPDGRSVAFSSRATNLVADDTNGYTDIFVHDFLEEQKANSSSDSGCFISTAADLKLLYWITLR